MAMAAVNTVQYNTNTFTNNMEILHKYCTTITQIVCKYFTNTRTSHWWWQHTTCQFHSNTLQYHTNTKILPCTNTSQQSYKYHTNTLEMQGSSQCRWPRVNGDEWPTTSLMLGRANNGNLSLCQNTSKGRKCLHQLWENMKSVKEYSDITMNWKPLKGAVHISC